ncbi:hypothetical protein OB2597_13728 [Pseudooceanicola batsensis HTCC2597]|uniref:Uncharacterized protein n=1 Tax=Pseudooceanicola batsensis (strain ATCC BAA-863 / DSM 15984 / KCTC 12145 / HTCC2597) TaxID=252305 RepID=A3TYH4_PSEBH|nr:hypothetical protein [Pseudooceanicola batsensis]EAQ03208.1 hypothetical protein OB2597_13728 [Pseudooceanicola batsensis HTCC2597]
MPDLTWTKKTLAEILGEDRGLSDAAALQAAQFRQEDLDDLLTDERQALKQALRDAAHAARNARQPEMGEGDTRPDFTAEDITEGLLAARSALEAVPAGKRSEKANALIADCACEPAGATRN